MATALLGSDSSGYLVTGSSANTCFFPIASATPKATTASQSTEANVQALAGASGIYSGLTANVFLINAGTPVITFRKNSAAGNQTITATVVGVYADATHTDSVVATDLLAGSKATTASSQNFSVGQVLFSFNAAAVILQSLGNVTASLSTASASELSNLYGPLGFQTAATLGVVDAYATAAGTVSGYSVKVATNTSTNTIASSFAKNGAAGAGSVIISGTGTFTDATHTDSLAVGNTLGAISVTGSGTVACAVNNIAASFAGSASAAPTGGAYGFALLTQGNSTNYSGPTGTLSNLTTESHAQGAIPSPMTLSTLTSAIGAAAGTNGTIISRINGAAGNQTITLSSANSWITDATHSDNVATGGLFDSQVIGPTTGSVAIGWTGYGVQTYSPNVSVNAPIVSASGMAAATVRQVSIIPGAVHATGAAKPPIFGPNVHPTIVHAAGASAAVTARVSVTAPAVFAQGVARPVAGTVAAHAAAAASAVANAVGIALGPAAKHARAFGIANPVKTTSPLIVTFPIARLMRTTPVATVGAMSDAPVALIGRLKPSGRQPRSVEITAPQAIATSHASGLQTSFNVTVNLVGVSAIAAVNLVTPAA